MSHGSRTHGPRQDGVLDGEVPGEIRAGYPDQARGLPPELRNAAD
jgi:hypothetical protein